MTTRKVALQRPANVVGLRLQAAPGHIMEYHGLPYETDFSIQRQPPARPLNTPAAPKSHHIQRPRRRSPQLAPRLAAYRARTR
ncbi:MAG: hypothetical protein Q8K87_16035 [Hydrogenophaga sp.]|nr:hypothetical protein [Hydrogenophaga sp.]